jgi:thioredoxin-related protein
MKILKLLLVLFIWQNLYAKDINFDKMIENANNNNKQIMIFFHMEHCPWCNQMIDLSLSKQDVKDTINQYFVYTDIDVESEGIVLYNNEEYSKIDFAREYNIYYYPTTIMIDNNIIVQNINGYRNKNKFTSQIKYIGTKSYKDMTLKEFIANEDFEND